MRRIFLWALPLIFAAGATFQPRKDQPIVTEAPGPTALYWVSPSVRDWIERGHRAYFAGDLSQAIKDYQKALQEAPTALAAWLNGASVWSESGNPGKASEWFERAAALLPNDERILTECGWADFQRRAWSDAERHFSAALAVDPRQTYALLGMGRVKMALRHPEEAVPFFDAASAVEPTLTLAPLWKGEALEQAGDSESATAAYRRAAALDSYMVEARYGLALAQMRRKLLPEAFKQLTRILNVDPDNRTVRSLSDNIRGLVAWKDVAPKKIWGSYRHRAEILSPTRGSIPILRIGIGVNASGHPLPRTGIDFETSTPFELIDGNTARTIARGDPRDRWRIRFLPGRPPALEVLNSQDHRIAHIIHPLKIRPDLQRGGSVMIHELPYVPGYHGNATRERNLRGEVELSILRRGNGFKIVDIVDLESYTHGVLSSEMPIDSPLEALKAQAVVARSHALYIATVSRIHRKDGYDLCDDQHCQVYNGIQAETERSRAVVEATRGRILTYHGHVADPSYSSNCGGHTQSSSELHGWGYVPYWKGIEDAPANSPPYPSSPWELRWYLRTTPQAYCMPISDEYSAHYRWSRFVSAQELQDRINRSEKIGRILGVQTLRRAVSGHVNSLRILGSTKDLYIRDEIRIRNLLAPGSQRSALFFVETEYGPDGRPSAFVFHGGGWGHGVGMCQSGAMGRALQGALYTDILKAYYPGTEIGNLQY